MATLGIILLFVVVGGAVAFVAFSGGPGKAREAYLTRGRRFFTVSMVLLYVGLGVAIPAVVIAGREAKEGNTGALANNEPTHQLQDGKNLFLATCATCHSLGAVNARGVTGPSLDNIGQVTEKRILDAIKNGGTGQGKMPANLLQGENAEAVAAYVAHVAGR
jgi:mono/diheme cytochrome c family protein